MTLAAIVGGTASKLGGGKFANGAVSGAFVHMYNYKAHLPDWMPEAGNSAEQEYTSLKVVNSITRFIMYAGDVIGEAFSGAYHGLSSMEERIGNIHNPKARFVGQAIYIKASGGVGASIGGPLLDSAQAGDLIETELSQYRKGNK